MNIEYLEEHFGRKLEPSLRNRLIKIIENDKIILEGDTITYTLRKPIEVNNEALQDVSINPLYSREINNLDHIKDQDKIVSLATGLSIEDIEKLKIRDFNLIASIIFLQAGRMKIGGRYGK